MEVEKARSQLDRADPRWQEHITLLAGDVRDDALPDQVAQFVPDGARCFVVEDSAHRHHTTLAALEGFSRFGRPGGFFIVEDGCVDVEGMRLGKDWHPRKRWPRGVIPAISDWLAGPGHDFVVRRIWSCTG